jgi:hypothetical protein
MMASVIMYGIIGYTISETMPPAEPMSHGMFLAIMAAVAAICGALSFALRARMMPARTRDHDGKIDESALSSEPARAALGKLRGALILSWALCEAVALCGLVVTFLFHEVADYAPFGAAALILLLVHAPKPALLVDVMNALGR